MNKEVKKLEEIKKGIKNPEFIKVIDKKIKNLNKTIHKDGN